MIPKIIHYCWFGRNPLPPLAVQCINSWKKHLTDYQIIEWNEDNFDLNSYLFTKEAYQEKKFAFVSDVCRLFAIKEYGGIYMDTDVEVLKSLDPLLHLNAFSGFEDDDTIPTGIMASEKEGKWATEMLNYYSGRSFINEDLSLDIVPNTVIITDMMKKKGIVMNNTYQEIRDYVAFFPKDYFCPKSYKTQQILLTENTYCIHHFASSWLPKKKKFINGIKISLMKAFGYENVQYLIDLFKKN